jgi:hypothetical protein
MSSADKRFATPEKIIKIQLLELDHATTDNRWLTLHSAANIGSVHQHCRFNVRSQLEYSSDTKFENTGEPASTGLATESNRGNELYVSRD